MIDVTPPKEVPCKQTIQLEEERTNSQNKESSNNESTMSIEEVSLERFDSSHRN